MTKRHDISKHQPDRYRPTHHIKRQAVSNCLAASDFANSMGVRLDHLVTINFKNVPHTKPVDAFASIRSKSQKYLSYHGEKHGLDGIASKPVYIYAFEAIGHPHVHWLMFIPDVLREEFILKLSDWYEATGIPLEDDTIRVSYLPTLSDTKRAAKYIMKGCDPEFAKLYYLHDIACPQGLHHGQRAGVSRAIGRTARNRAHYMAKYDREEILAAPVNDNPMNDNNPDYQKAREVRALKEQN